MNGVNIFEVRYELERQGAKPAVRKGFCVMSDRFLAKFSKAIEKKAAKGEDSVEIGLSVPDHSVTFFSEKGVRTVCSGCLSAWPVGQEPLNLAHWTAFIVVKPGESEWRVRDAG